MEDKQIVRVGLGVLIEKDNKVLLGKRKNSHGEATWSLPGGHVEFGESFEECAIREVKEETDLDISPEEVITVSNDIMYGKHYVTIGVKGNIKSGIPKLMEPHKCEKWAWFALHELPSPLFIATRDLLELYRQGRVTKVLENEK